MHIKKPQKALGKSIKMKNLKLAMAHGKSTPIADLNVTPMVDMLTMLVIFLLMTFSASGELLMVSKDIVLPSAFHGAALETAPCVSVSNGSIGFGGQFVMNTADVTETAYPDWKLTPLFNLLDAEREAWSVQNARREEEFKGNVIIQSDNEVPFSVLKLVMSTCAKAKYVNMNFAITQVGKGEANLGN